MRDSFDSRGNDDELGYEAPLAIFPDDDEVEYDPPVITFDDDDEASARSKSRVDHAPPANKKTARSSAAAEREPAAKTEPPLGSDDEDDPIFIFDDNAYDADDESEEPVARKPEKKAAPQSGRGAATGKAVPPRSEDSERIGFSFGRADDVQKHSPSAPQQDDSEFVFMPFLDDKPTEEEDSGSIKLSFSKVTAQKKEKEFVFMPFLNDKPTEDEPEPEESDDGSERYRMRNGYILDEGLKLIPLVDPEEEKKVEAATQAAIEMQDSLKEDSGISVVGGSQLPFAPVTKTNTSKPAEKKSKSGSKKPSSGHSKASSSSSSSSSSSARAKGGSIDAQFRAAMKNIDPQVLASVRDDPIQMAALEQAIRIALVQQAAQAAVEKTTGRSFLSGVMPSSALQGGGSAPHKNTSGKKKSRPPQSRGNGFGMTSINPAGVNSFDSLPTEFGVDRQSRENAAKLSDFVVDTNTKPIEQVSAAPAAPAEQPPLATSAVAQPAYTPSPNAQQDPAMAAFAQAKQQPATPAMPNVEQDPALAALSATMVERPDPERDTGVRKSRGGVPINSSPAAVRAAMRSTSGTEQIRAQNAARAVAAQSSGLNEPDADVSKRSGCLVLVIIAFIVFFIGLILVAVWPAISKELDYQTGVSLLTSGDYLAAAEQFNALGEYKDCATRADEAVYNYASGLQTEGKYADALENFLLVDQTYSDTSEHVAECRYQLGVTCIEQCKYSDAYDYLYLIPKYRDAADLAMDANYKAAAELLENGLYEKAELRYEMFPDYLDSRDKYCLCHYKRAQQLFGSGDYDTAYQFYNILGDYKDSKYLAAISQYDAIVSGSKYSVDEMQNALYVLAENSDQKEAREILNSSVYNCIKLIGYWTCGDYYIRFEYTDTGNRLVTFMDDASVVSEYTDVIINQNYIIKNDNSRIIFTISGFDSPYSAQPQYMDMSVDVLGHSYTFERAVQQ